MVIIVAHWASLLDTDHRLGVRRDIHASRVAEAFCQGGCSARRHSQDLSHVSGRGFVGGVFGRLL
jgi:hypothetical protein